MHCQNKIFGLFFVIITSCSPVSWLFAEDISVKIYPLTDKSYESISIDKICEVTQKSIINAEIAGFDVIELALIELHSPPPGISTEDPFVFRGKQEIPGLGGNAFSIEKFFTYKNTEMISDMALKVYRIEYNRKPTKACGYTLDGWKDLKDSEKRWEKHNAAANRYNALKSNAYHVLQGKHKDKKDV